MLEDFENIRRKALELFHDDKLTITDHALERMIERDIAIEDIESVLNFGSFHKKEIDEYGDIRYSMRGMEYKNNDIRITFIVKDELIIITVIRE